MNPIRAWNTFWFRPISARPLGAFRIVFGVLILCHLGFLALEMDYWLSDAGLLTGPEARAVAGPMRPSPLQWVQSPLAVHVFVGAVSTVALLFTLGWRTRVMGVLLYLGMLSIHHRSLSSVSGADSLLMVMAFYLMLSPCGAAYSLDARRAARRRGWAEAEPLIVPWAQRLIQLQLSLIYFATAVWKCHGPTWLNGTALHFVLNNAEVRQFNLGLTDFPILIDLMTHSALLLEFALAFLIWVKAARPWVMLAGLALHGGIVLTVNIPIFGELMTACYLTFLTPQELDTFLGRINPRRWFARREKDKARAAIVLPTPTSYHFNDPAEFAGPHTPTTGAPRPAPVREDSFAG